MQRTCEACSAPYEASRPTARFCSERCKKRVQRGQVPFAVAPPTARASGTESGTAARVRAELDAAGRLETYLGAAALALAERIDESTAVMGFAALVKELRSTMDAAMAGVQQAADPVDELRSRRDRKYAG